MRETGIEAGCGLVEKKDLRVVDQAAGNLDAAAHASGKGLDLRAAPFDQVHGFKHVVYILLALDLGNTVELGVDAEVFFDGEIGSLVSAWGMTPIMRRTASLSLVTSWPPTMALPEVMGTSVVIMRMSVLLPAPFGPSKPKISPSATEKLTSLDGFKSAVALDDVLAPQSPAAPPPWAVLLLGREPLPSLLHQLALWDVDLGRHAGD